MKGDAERKRLGALLRAGRERLELPTRAAADRLGGAASYATLNKVERGEPEIAARKVGDVVEAAARAGILQGHEAGEARRLMVALGGKPPAPSGRPGGSEGFGWLFGGGASTPARGDPLQRALEGARTARADALVATVGRDERGQWVQAVLGLTDAGRWLGHALDKVAPTAGHVALAHSPDADAVAPDIAAYVQRHGLTVHIADLRGGLRGRPYYSATSGFTATPAAVDEGEKLGVF